MKLRRLIALSISSVNFLSTTYLSHLKNRVMPQCASRATLVTQWITYRISAFRFQWEYFVQRKWHIVGLSRHSLTEQRGERATGFLRIAELVSFGERTTPELFPAEVM